MRHGIAGNKLGRNQSLRKATVRDLAKATLQKQRICTTKAKAKESRKLVDKLITMGKRGTLAEKRRAFAVLCDHKLVSDLFTNIAPRFATRNGGYTRIISLANNRRGDNAEMVFLELTEKEGTIISKVKASIAVDKQSYGASSDSIEEAEVVEEVQEETKPSKKVAKKKTTKLSKTEE